MGHGVLPKPQRVGLLGELDRAEYGLCAPNKPDLQPALLHLRRDIGKEIGHGPHAEITAPGMTDGDATSGGFLLTEHEHVGHFVELRE